MNYRSRTTSHRRAFTLVEMMVSTSVSLILILGVVEAFQVIGEAVADGRATLTMSGQVRTITNRLQNDLAGVTAPARAWALEGAGLGYTEIGEGPATDSFNFGPDGQPGAAGTDDDNNGTTDDFTELGWVGTDDNDSLQYRSMLGDFDDYVAFTVRSREGQFVGTYKNVAIRSNEAEIIWWTELDDANQNGHWDLLPLETFTLRRRVLLIRPDLNRHPGPDGEWGIADPGDDGIPDANETGKFGAPGSDDLVALYVPAGSLASFLEINDLSVHIDPVTGLYVANSLADLTLRHNRVGHLPLAVNFPNYTGYHPGPDGQWGVAGTDDDGNGTTDDMLEMGRGDDLKLFPRHNGIRLGEDVMISHVLAFDVKVFDPRAPVLLFDQDANDIGDEQTLAPGDPLFMLNLPVVGQGTFVDLFYGRIRGIGNGVTSLFSGPPHAKSQLNRITPFATYDTWSVQYEADGLNQDGDAFTDEGSNGLDNPDPLLAANLQNPAVDDASERETSPPYPFPLRGIQISLRVLDPDSRQVRQMTVVNDFTPE
ncbi:MAG: prepilin-type N-terminal cleavage/methylation domain-containing protein [Planctomycetota bacterium]|nr:prepilin-type N-terminal cleavage/methylation domain-containing protein [Planctomycetota bacterium]